MDTSEIWDRLGKVALQDGNLSADENKILMEVLRDVDKYRIVLNRVVEDGIIDDDEQERLTTMRTTLIDKMKNIAQSDGTVSNEENELIKETIKIIKELDEESKKMLR